MLEGICYPSLCSLFYPVNSTLALHPETYQQKSLQDHSDLAFVFPAWSFHNPAHCLHSCETGTVAVLSTGTAIKSFRKSHLSTESNPNPFNLSLPTGGILMGFLLSGIATVLHVNRPPFKIKNLCYFER